MRLQQLSARLDMEEYKTVLLGNTHYYNEHLAGQ